MGRSFLLRARTPRTLRCPPNKPKPRFKANEAFRIKRPKSVFVASGDDMDGIIRRGMTLHVPVNHAVAIAAEIQSIEFVDAKTGDAAHVGLVFHDDGDGAQLLESLDLEGELLEVM